MGWSEEHDQEDLIRGLTNEIQWREGQIKKLKVLRRQLDTKTALKKVGSDGWGQYCAYIMDILTHRSNVHPETIVRACSRLAAHAAVRWTKAHPEDERF